MAFQHGMFRGAPGCKLLDTKTKLKALKKNEAKLEIFLPRLQREKENLILDQLKVKANQQRRGEFQAANSAECSSFCAHDAFCRAFVMCDPVQGSWCQFAKGNCLLYSKLQVTAVQLDIHSEMHFVWKDYTKAKENID